MAEIGIADLVLDKDGKAMTTSLKIAEVFCKGHDKVLRSIKNNLNNFTNANFGESVYTDNSGKANPMYYLDRDFATFLIMGFTGEKAKEFKLAYIKAFNAMEAKLKEASGTPHSFKEALWLAYKQQEKIEEQQKQLTLQAPKVNYYDEVLDTDNAVKITVIAKELGMSAIKLNRLLHELGVQYRQGDNWHLYEKYQDKGYIRIRTSVINNKSFHDMLWTEKGREFIHGIIKENNTICLPVNSSVE